ncbi:MAG: AbrB/MazE/SpoVT family DNA-binding domain-containing protein [Planctomycetaceae bacterium]
MIAKVQKWGNSLGLRIPQTFAKDLGIDAGAEVELTIEDERLVLAPVRRRKYNLHDLLEQMTDENIHPEWDTGGPVGREVW